MLTDSFSTLNLLYKSVFRIDWIYGVRVYLFCYSWLLRTYTHTCVNTYIHTDLDTLHSCMLTQTFTTYSIHLALSRHASKINKETHYYNTTILQNLVSVPHRILIFFSIHSTWFWKWDISSRIPTSFIRILKLTNHINLTISTKRVESLYNRFRLSVSYL